MSEHDYGRLGLQLRDARLAKRIDMRAAANALHIRPRYLQALEDGELSVLPGDTFVAGYIARYATFLGLNSDEMVEAFGAAGAIPQRRLLYIPDSMRTDDHPSPQLLLMSLAVAVFAMWFLPAQLRSPHFMTKVVSLPMQENMWKNGEERTAPGIDG